LFVFLKNRRSIDLKLHLNKHKSKRLKFCVVKTDIQEELYGISAFLKQKSQGWSSLAFSNSPK
jgi:hypothetical protein